MIDLETVYIYSFLNGKSYKSVNLWMIVYYNHGDNRRDQLDFKTRLN